MPALDAAIQQAKQNIDHIKSNKQPADFENTIVALETASEDVGLVSGSIFNMLSAEASDELQALAKTLVRNFQVSLATLAWTPTI